MRPPGPDELREYLAFGEAVARDTRAFILEHIGQDASHRLKADGSFVTDIDLGVEDLVRERLRAAFPDHGVLGEERVAAPSESLYEWVIDPIDGTKSLRHRIPLFGTLIALTRLGRPVVGIIDLPMLNRTYAGALGLGAHCNGRRLSLEDLGNAADLPGEVIAIGDRRQFADCDHADAFDRLMAAHPGVRTYCDCFGHTLAIEGAAGAMVDYNLHLWDFAASEILTNEAGGRFRRIDACARSNRAGGHYDVIFGKPRVVEWLSETLGVL